MEGYISDGEFLTTNFWNDSTFMEEINEKFGILPTGNNTHFYCPTPLVYIDTMNDPPHSTKLHVVGACVSPCPTVDFTSHDWNVMTDTMTCLVYIALIMSLLCFCAHLFDFQRFFIRIMFIGGFLGNCIVFAVFLTTNNSIHGGQNNVVCNTPSYFVSKGGLCVFQAAATIWFFMWTNTWSAILSLDTYLRVCMELSKPQLQALKYKYLLAGIVIPSVIVAIPLGTNNLGFDPYASVPVCLYMISENKDFFWISFVLPFYILLTLAIIFTVLTGRRIHNVLIASRYYERHTSVNSASPKNRVKHGDVPAGGQTGAEVPNTHTTITTVASMLESEANGFKIGHGGATTSEAELISQTVRMRTRFTYDTAHDDEDDVNVDTGRVQSFHNRQNSQDNLSRSRMSFGGYSFSFRRNGTGNSVHGSESQRGSEPSVRGSDVSIIHAGVDPQIEDGGTAIDRTSSAGNMSTTSSSTTISVSVSTSVHNTAANSQINSLLPYSAAPPTSTPVQVTTPHAVTTTLQQMPAHMQTHNVLLHKVYNDDFCDPSMATNNKQRIDSVEFVNYDAEALFNSLPMMSFSSHGQFDSGAGTVTGTGTTTPTAADPTRSNTRFNSTSSGVRSTAENPSFNRSFYCTTNPLLMLLYYLLVYPFESCYYYCLVHDRFAYRPTGTTTTTTTIGTSNSLYFQRTSQLLKSIWRYNGPSMIFVLVFCLTTVCVLPIVINLYLVKFDSFLNSGTDFEECLVEASFLCRDQTQLGVDACALSRCGEVPQLRPSLGQVKLLNILIIIVFYRK
jgi:hypothetical protein